jgi:hypothetical protein
LDIGLRDRYPDSDKSNLILQHIMIGVNNL